MEKVGEPGVGFLKPPAVVNPRLRAKDFEQGWGREKVSVGTTEMKCGILCGTKRVFHSLFQQLSFSKTYGNQRSRAAEKTPVDKFLK
jgi:hypothetical protein